MSVLHKYISMWTFLLNIALLSSFYISEMHVCFNTVCFLLSLQVPLPAQQTRGRVWVWSATQQETCSSWGRWWWWWWRRYGRTSCLGSRLPSRGRLRRLSYRVAGQRLLSPLLKTTADAQIIQKKADCFCIQLPFLWTVQKRDVSAVDMISMLFFQCSILHKMPYLITL